MSNPLPDKETEKTSVLPCICAASRRASRLLTARYNRHLEPVGLKVTQYSMLANINRNPDISVSTLAKLLAMDQTTVTRNLQVLLKSGFVHLEPDEGDQRIRRVRISERGADVLEKGRSLWAEAQQEVREILGPDGTANLLDYFTKLSE